MQFECAEASNNSAANHKNLFRHRCFALNLILVEAVRSTAGSRVKGFAGATADAFTLLDRFEGKLKEYRGSLQRAAVELAKDWRTDRYLRRLEALLLVADREHTLLISGTGDVIEPDGECIAIGSGGLYALAAARALCTHTELDARTIATEALTIASGIDVFTNDQLVVETLGA